MEENKLLNCEYLIFYGLITSTTCLALLRVTRYTPQKIKTAESSLIAEKWSIPTDTATSDADNAFTMYEVTESNLDSVQIKPLQAFWLYIWK